MSEDAKLLNTRITRKRFPKNPEDYEIVDWIQEVLCDDGEIPPNIEEFTFKAIKDENNWTIEASVSRRINTNTD